MIEKSNKYLVVALLLGLLFHGGSIAFTLEETYDALIHLFFAEHYSTQWFDPWNESWYTGFTVMAYPPLVHQSMALLSEIGGLKFSLYAMALTSVLLFITGVYRFSLLLSGDRKVAGYASLLAVFSSSFLETLHLFGQLPSIVGISVLMHALPEIYAWLKNGRKKHLVFAWSLLAVTVCSHHVTPIFGMVFFIFPLIGLVVMDIAAQKAGSYKDLRFGTFWKVFAQKFKTIITFGMGSLLLILVCILPYWVNTKQNPITQVPIPHGSRDNFLDAFSSGLVFFVIPWGVLLLFLPYFFYRYFSKRYIFFGLSLGLLALLGTGSTTPASKLILGENAFNILTLDRFTLWATIMVLPIFGEFTYRFAEGDLKQYIQNAWGARIHRFMGGVLALSLICVSIFTLNLSNFRPTQPEKIDMLPIVNFLNQDQHDRWRYLTLGFGDQMAWLSAQTDAASVDGNYHSARRLPELTSRAVERLENSKFRGIEGLGSLQQFLAVPEKYHLKYVFSNDKFYDPLLYFTGWQRLPMLENGISVWERSGVPPIPKINKKERTPSYLRLMWGIIPITTLIIACIIGVLRIVLKNPKDVAANQCQKILGDKKPRKRTFHILKVCGIWVLLILGFVSYGFYQFHSQNAPQIAPQNVVKAYFNAIDFKEFEQAHIYISPLSNKSLDQFMLEISVSDGLLGSYGKLDAIKMVSEEATETTNKLRVTSSWITPLKKVEKEEIINTVFHNGKWYVVPPHSELDIPPDLIISSNHTTYYNHGRRRISSEQTYHEDIVRQPVVEVIDSRLIVSEGKYKVVGLIQNVDRIPADIAISCTLYGVNNEVLGSYNAKDIIKHKLLPMETTPFVVDFEEIAWVSNTDVIPKTFNPEEFTQKQFDMQPTHYGIEVSANLATSDLYNEVVVQKTKMINGTFYGELFNKGSQNSTVPQLLLSYYDENKNLITVQSHYLEESIRPQRSISFKIPLPLNIDYEILHSNPEQVYINGIPNANAARKMLSVRIPPNPDYLIETYSESFPYVGITINNYIGNPRP
ncbi:hypothetical protein POV27_16620 [Aureisphaera galaxeae]|uniref:hypothetical protein n=1 Tax=Aureisphaera galaxeae TaxID=1538023 RepID=UPI002350EFA2|nr:hypothetical protein [Aureisphaera galaxeae]MDC8005684.1 hypothetical protein [Aureisphaera galaxeae]